MVKQADPVPILIDSRIGSVELVDHLPPSLTLTTHLDYGDVCWVGNGPKHEMMIGVERKRIRDFLSSTASGRLSGHQLPGLLNSYNKVYVVIEGIWRPSPNTGVIEMRNGRGWHVVANGKRTWGYAEVVGMIESMTNIMGIEVWQTVNIEETARWILAAHKWWGRDWSTHKSHVLPHAAAPTPQLSRLTMVRKVALQIDGVGWERSKDIGKKFATVADMTQADEANWKSIPGIGAVLAQKIMTALGGKKE